MGFLHQDFHLTPDQVVVVTVDRQANVMLLDDNQYQNYSHGRQFHYHGGLAEQSPVHLSPPHTGRWHVVIDLGGADGAIRHSIRVLG